MTRIRWDRQYNKYRVLFSDGSHGWISRRGMEELYPDYNWDIVKEFAGADRRQSGARGDNREEEKSSHWFYF